MNEIITLISLKTLRDSGSRSYETNVFASVSSVGQKETYAAAAVGVKPELSVRISDYLDYNQQPFVKYNGRLYKVYRTYRGSHSNIRPFAGQSLELTLTSPVGLRDTIGTCYLGPSRKEALCAVAYVQMSEIDDGGLSGLIRELHLIVSADVFAGESSVEYDGKRYAIRRVYQEDRDIVDLYVEERAGI